MPLPPPGKPPVWKFGDPATVKPHWGIKVK